MKKHFLMLALLVTTSALLAACTSGTRLDVAPTPSPTMGAPVYASPDATIASPTLDGKKQAVYEFTAQEEGQTALELLSSQAVVETKDYGDAGSFVTSINSLAGSNEYYWAFYVNGAYAEKGASQTTLRKGDTIRFVYEAVTPAL